MDTWLDELAEALGVEPLDAEETREILDAARGVARGVERRYAPLASFLLGVASGSGSDSATGADAGSGTGSGGGSREEAFQAALARLRALIPPDEAPDSAG